LQLIIIIIIIIIKLSSNFRNLIRNPSEKQHNSSQILTCWKNKRQTHLSLRYATQRI